MNECMNEWMKEWIVFYMAKIGIELSTNSTHVQTNPLILIFHVVLLFCVHN